jgi:light-regulated signal transduction histidine kinase (bacteriophytochrome)
MIRAAAPLNRRRAKRQPLQNTSHLAGILPDYAVAGWFLVCRQMKAAAASPNQAPSRDDVDARVALLEAELNRTRQEMRTFSYSVSHDLRAPLRAIEGFTRIIAEDYGQVLDDEGRKFLQHVLQNTQIMGALIEGLLNYHRLNERQVHRTPVDMTQLARDVVAAVSPPDKPPEVTIAKLPVIDGDPALIRIAMEQLVSNAMKFSKRNPAPKICFGADDRDGENIIWIKDNGVGFDMQYGNKLFQIFQKLQKDADFDGHGVGLALVRRVAEKHDGRVWAEATPNEGATFYFAVPK